MTQKDVYTTYARVDIEEASCRLGPHSRRSHGVVRRKLAVNDFAENIARDDVLELQDGWVGAGLGGHKNLDAIGIGQVDELLSLLNSGHEGELGEDVLLGQESGLDELVVAVDVDDDGNQVDVGVRGNVLRRTVRLDRGWQLVGVNGALGRGDG